MKFSKHTALLAAVLFAAGCQPNAQTPPVPTPSAAASTLPTAPVISSLDYSPKSAITKSDVLSFSLVATDTSGKELQYIWTATKGMLTASSGSSVGWRPVKADGSLDPGQATVRVIVSNGTLTSTGTVNILIDEAGQATITAPPIIENTNLSSGGSRSSGGGSSGTSSSGGNDTSSTTPSPSATPAGLPSKAPTEVGTLGARPGTAAHTSSPANYLVSNARMARRSDGMIIMLGASRENHQFAELQIIDPARFIGDPQYVRTLVGGKTMEILPGPAAEAGIGRGDFNNYELACDGEGNTFIINQNRLLKVDQAGNVTVLGGNDSGVDEGPIGNVHFRDVQAMCADRSGNIYVFSRKENGVRLMKIDTSLNVRLLDGSTNGGIVDGANFSGTMDTVTAATLAPDGKTIYFLDRYSKFFTNPDSTETSRQVNYLRQWTPSGGLVTVAGGHAPTPEDAERFTPGKGVAGNIGATASTTSIAVDTDNNAYVPTSTRLVKVSADGTVSSIAGALEGGYKNGTGSEARFGSLYGAVYADGMVILQESGWLRTLQVK